MRFDDVRRVERRLFDFGEEVVRVAVQFENTHVMQREIAVIPHFGQVEAD